MQSKRLTRFILIALVLGVVSGVACSSYFPQHTQSFAANVSLLPIIFLRLIKMIIAPLVFSTLVVGIAKLGDIAAVGRVGGKALAWFLFASVISLSIGLVLVQVFEPGKAMALQLPVDSAQTGVVAGSLTLRGFIEHTVPTSILDAMSRNEILQIVVFAVFFGTAMAALGERTKIVIDLFDAVAHIMLKVTGYVMLLAPIAVFGALAATVAEQGLRIVGVYSLFVAEFYLGLIVLAVVLASLGALVLGSRVMALLRRVREPVILAFSTASSEAAYPKTLEELERFGISNRVASFVLPTGYSFNLDGSMMYCAFGVMFIAQAYGIELTLAEQVLLLAVLMLTSKGIAGVPRAALVVIAATLVQFDIPEAGLVLLIGVDQFFDMGRSAMNVVGNSIATAVVAKWEGELDADTQHA